MNYCSHCGSNDLRQAIPQGDNRLRTVCGNCGTIHYSNPKIVAGCLAIWEDQILLCRRAIEPAYGLWNIPSGYLENGETVEAGAMRELIEEAEASVKLFGMHALYSIPRINQVYIHFIGQLVDGRFGVGVESLESRLFSAADIPWQEIAFSSSTFSLRHYLEDRERGDRRLHIGAYPNS